MSEVALGQPPTPPPYAVSMVQLAVTGAESSRQAKKSFFAFWSDQNTPIRFPPNAVMVEMSSATTFVCDTVMNVNDVPSGAVYPTRI
jgi:hypothetical protein